MKRTLTLIACVAICCAMMVSCKNAKTTEPTPEEIQVQKIALADSVLAEIDAFAEEYVLASESTFRIPNFELTDAEKMVKPDYLLDPSFANTLVTKSQKVNALAIYVIDYGIRQIYDMPLDETKEVIAKLTAELNHPLETTVFADFEKPISEKIKKEYEECKERGDLAFFWQFQNAVTTETGYVIAHNPELFYSKITEDQLQQYVKKIIAKNQALSILAAYDEEVAEVSKLYNQTRVCSSDEQFEKDYASIECAIQYNIANKEKHVDKRATPFFSNIINSYTKPTDDPNGSSVSFLRQ